MRKHGGFTPCEGAGRIRPQARDHRAQGRTAVPSALHRLFQKANVHRREPQVPQEQSGHRESQALIFRGGHTRNRVVFINSGRGHGGRGRRPEAVVSLTWPYACCRSRRPSASGGKRPARALQGPSRSLPLMKTSRFLAGAPLFFLPRKFADAGKALARASGRKRAEQRRAGESAVDWAAHQSWARRSIGQSSLRARGLPRKRRG